MRLSLGNDLWFCLVDIAVRQKNNSVLILEFGDLDCKW